MWVGFIHTINIHIQKKVGVGLAIFGVVRTAILAWSLFMVLIVDRVQKVGCFSLRAYFIFSVVN